MRKTPLMLEVEKKVGQKLEDFLQRIFENGSIELRQSLGVHRSTLCRWCIKFGFEKRIKRPSREVLNYSYNVLRKSVRKSASELEVNRRTYYRWLESAGIERRQGSGTYLSNGAIPYSKEDLEKSLAQRTNAETATLYGIDTHTLRTWKQKHGIFIFRKSKYDKLSLRVAMLYKLVHDSDKEVEKLSSLDFKRFKQPDGRSYRGVLNWYLNRYAHLYPIAK